MFSLNKINSLLHWLPASGPQDLGNVCLLGQDGWADGRLGNFEKSNVSLNDSLMISELFAARIGSKHTLLKKMQELADKDAMKLASDFKKAIKFDPKRIIVLTHVPPFREACMYQGKVSSDDFLPYFGSKVIGDVLLKFASENPDRDFLVLCGDTHNKSLYQPTDNLTIRVGKAEYFSPKITDVIQLKGSAISRVVMPLA